MEISIFLLPIPRPLVSSSAGYFENGHGVWVRGQITSLPEAVRSFMYSTYPIPTAASRPGPLFRTTVSEGRRWVGGWSVGCAMKVRGIFHFESLLRAGIQIDFLISDKRIIALKVDKPQIRMQCYRLHEVSQ